MGAAQRSRCLSSRATLTRSTGLDVDPSGTRLLSHSMDHSLRVWDVQPFAAGGDAARCKSVLQAGGGSNFEGQLLRCSWSWDGSKIAAGSADRNVCVWDVDSGALMYRLPGHSGSVLDVAFHPTQPILASGGVDSDIYLGEVAL